MAKQPDFAQKPPDDLPARKDRMDLPQATRRLDLDPRPTEKHDGSRWPLRGSGETAGKKMRSGPEQTHGTVVAGGSWRKIYELGHTGSFNHGGRYMNWEAHRKPSASGFLLHPSSISSGGKEEDRNQASATPHASRLQMEEISRGAEKIRRILRAYYREYESDRGSVDIGRDLLRGVIDLKESLSRLQRLQGATDSMAKKPQREGAALLKEKEDDERSKKHKTLKNRTLSFHGVPKYPLEGDRGLQRQTAVKPNSGEYVDDSVKIGSHRRSMSCAPSFRLETTVLASRNEPNKERVHKSSDSKSPMEAVSKNNAPIRDTQRVPSQVSYGDEKKMIPNVIARLMGLEDLPTFKTESKNRGGKEVTHSGQEARTSKNLRPSMEGNEERTHMETLAEESALRKGVRTRVLPEKELVAIRIIRSSEGLNSGTTSSEPKADGNASTLTEVGLVFEDLQDPPLVYNLHATKSNQYRNPHSETRDLEFCRGHQDVLNGKRRFTVQGCHLNDIDDEKTLQLETKSAPVKTNSPRSIRETRNERLVPKSNGFAVDKRSTSAIDKMHVKNSFKSRNKEKMTISCTRNIGYQVLKKAAKETLELGKLSRTGSSKSNKENTKLLVPSGNSLPSRKIKQNAGAVSLPQGGNVGKRLTEADGFQSRTAKNPPSEKQTHISQEMSQEKEGNVRREEIISLNLPNLEKQLQKKAQSTACDMLDLSPSHCMMTQRKYGEKLSYANINKNMRDKVPEKQPSELSVRVDQELHPLHTLTNSVSGSTKIMQCIKTKSDSSNEHDRSMPEFDKEFHTDGEKQIREILTRSRLFQSTAKTLFKINVPETTIEAGKNAWKDEGNKIIVDSANEVMRRKGKREEVDFLYPMEMSSAAARVRCLDDLIKDLNSDIENLQFSSSNEEYLDMSEFLHEILTRDINITNPDVNCMWDLGWKSDVFVCSGKAEVIRDVEKHVLNRLIDHIVEDLLNVRIMHE